MRRIAIFVLLIGFATASAQPVPEAAARIAELEAARRQRPRDLAVLDALAGSYAMLGRYDQAIAVLREMLALGGGRPEWKLRLAKLYAWSGRPQQALQQFQEAPAGGDPEAVEIHCQLLAMAGRAAEAASCYRRLIPLCAGRPEKAAQAQLQLGRNEAWSGQTARAIRSYEACLRARPKDRQAAVELIRLRRYHGDYSQAVGLCDRLLRENPDDAEVLALKAEALHWAGHQPFLAHRTAERAVRLAPDLPDARVAQVYALGDLGRRRDALRAFGELQELVRRQGGPRRESTFADAYRFLEELLAAPRVSESPAYSDYNDSDGIHNSFSGVTLAGPVLRDHSLRFDFGRRWASAPASSIFTAGRDRLSVREFSAGGTLHVGPAANLTLRGGTSERFGRPGLRPAFETGFSAVPLDRWTVEVSAAREFLNVTPRAIELETSSYRLTGRVQYAIDALTSISVRAGRRYWSDDNRSFSGEAAFRRILHYHRPFMIDGGTVHRWEQFRRDTHFAAGFFTPDRYLRHDGFLGIHGELRRRLTYELRGAAGAHRLTRNAGYRTSWEVASSLNLRLSRHFDIYASYQRRNYSLLARNGWYQGFYIGLGIRQ